MNHRSAYLAIVTFFIMIGEVHAATYNLPRQFSLSEMPTTGVAFVNPTLSTASATFYWRTAQGEIAATTQRSIPARSQMAAGLDQLFPGISVPGWLSVDVDVDQISGFWLTGDYVNSTDGAPLLTSTNAIAYPVFTYFSSASEISFVNLGSSSLSGSLRLVSSTGSMVASVPFELPSFGLYQAHVATLFPNQAGSFDSDGYWISVSSSTSTARVIGTAVTPRESADNLVTNAAYVSLSRFLFPQIVGGAIAGTIYDTQLILTNYGASTQSVALTLRQASGSPLTAQRTIPGYGVIRTSVTSLFGAASVDGWLFVEATAAIGGLVTYTDTINGGSTAVEMQASTGSSTLMFGHIADLAPWWTGIALANSGPTDAQVEVYAHTPAGTLIGGPAQSARATFTLPAQSKRAFLLGDVIPQTQTRTSDGGYVYVKTTNGVQIHGTELFFLRSGRVYANVPATRLSGIAFTPAAAAPTIVAPGTVTVEETYIGDANQQPLTSAVQPCAVITLNMRVNNTTGRTVTVTRQYRAIGPNGYTLLMSSVSGDQAAGRSLRFTSVTVPCDAPGGNYSFIGSVDYNGVISSASVTFVGIAGATGGGGTGGGGTGGGGTTAGNCPATSTDGSLCVLTTDYTGVPLLTATACYDVYTGRSSVSAMPLLAVGGSPLSGYTWTLAAGSVFPPGTTVEPLTGIFKSNGGNLIIGVHRFTMEVSDGSRTAQGTYTLTVQRANSDINAADFSMCGVAVFGQPQVERIVLPNARQGRGYGASLMVDIGSVTNLSWSLAGGELPAGMSIDQARGVVRGTPFSSAARAAPYRFKVQVTGINREGNRVAANCFFMREGNCPEYEITVQ